MPNNYGYGPTRNLNPQRLKDLNADTHATGNISSLVVGLGAAVLEKNGTLHGELVARDADLFDGFGTFLAGIEDLNDNYGAGGGAPTTGDGWVTAFDAWVAANGTTGQKATFNSIKSDYPGSFTTFTAFIAMLDAIIDIAASATTLFAMWSTFSPTYNSTAPFAIVPHAKTSNAAIGTDMDDMNLWLTALAAPGLGGIKIMTE